MPDFEIIGDITNQEVIARGTGIHILTELRATHGGRNWRKYKGEACLVVESVGRNCTGMKRTVSASGA